MRTALLCQPPGPGHYAVHAGLVEGDNTLCQLAPAWHAELTVDETGVSLSAGSGEGAAAAGAARAAPAVDLASLPAVAQLLTLDFL